MKRSNSGSFPLDASNRQSRFYSILPPAAVLCMAFLLCGALLIFGAHENGIAGLLVSSSQMGKNNTSNDHVEMEHQNKQFQTQSKPSPHHRWLPRGIVRNTSDLEMIPITGPRNGEKPSSLKSLLAIPVGIKQKEGVNEIVKKFAPDNFTVMLFHYDGNVDGWKDLEWSAHALHISAMSQTKWWFAKRFLHPDIVSEYNYIFLWDEDLGVENFDPLKYIEIVKKEGLEISQPALDPKNSEIHHGITTRWGGVNVHRTMHKLSDTEKCEGPPCSGWVEMMAPVFSRSAWSCTWGMIQNDLIHCWGLDMKLGYCALGDRRKNVGVVDSQYIAHKGLSTLGDNEKKASSKSMTEREGVRKRSYIEMEIFTKRWQKAIKDDDSWSDPYPS